MADTKISNLTELTTAEPTDVLPIVNNGETQKITKANILKEVQEDIDNHVGDTANPHGVDKTDVGLGNVPNLDTTDAVANEHTHNNLSLLETITEAFTTALKTAYDSAVTWISTNGTNLINHLSNTSNPHNVTKTQVGLGNVDDTADADKPVSTAQQAALDLKADTSSLGAVATSNDYNDLDNLPDLSAFDNFDDYDKLSSFPAIGELGVIYLARDTGLIYRWDGVSAYAVMSPDLALGETSDTAYRGDRGATAYTHSQVTTGNPHNVLASQITDFLSAVRATILTGLSTASASVISATDTVLSALGKLQAQVSLNNAKVTNATHTGDATGATALTLASTAISGKTEKTTRTGSDEFLINEGGTLKKITEANLLRTEIPVTIFPKDYLLQTGDGKEELIIGSAFNGWKVIGFVMDVRTPSTSSLPNFQVARGRRASSTTAPVFVDILSTPVTINVNHYSSLTATTPAVVNASNAGLQTGDILRFDCDGKGTGTKGWLSSVIVEPA